jgi:hypothetical protein
MHTSEETSMISRIARAASPTLLAGLVATLVACQGGGAAPEFQSVEPQIGQVGVQLSITLRATDPDGDDLAFSFASTIPDVQTRAVLTRSPSGDAIWRWTPLAADVGLWYVDFRVTDGDNSDTLTVQIDVRSAIGGEGAPVFRQPLGTGTTLDLQIAQCVEVPIVIEDQDSTSVVITEEEPRVEGATLTSTGGLTATWRWCPSTAQVASDDDRFTVTLAADDLSNPKTLKTYLVVLRDGGRPDCPGDAPVITHTPTNESTISGLTIDARVRDDRGLKQAPLFYYSTTNPGTTPNLGQMTQLSMLQIDGTMRDGTWAADVPNPVASQPIGTTRTLYYVIVADDDDDPSGGCDHVTQSPVYSMTVTNPGGGGTTGLCGRCTTDQQCGTPGGLCMRVGVQNESFCLQGCTTGSCPNGYTCSASPVTSVDGQTARQCIPNTGSCTGGTSCVDDLWEDNDNRAQASAQGPLWDGDLWDLVSCPLVTGDGDDEDFFEIDLVRDTNVRIEISGEANTDLDLALQTSTGTVLQSSTSLSSDETITRCLTPGRYYARVYAWGTGRNPYLLSYDETPMSCSGTCVDDNLEPDNSMGQANPTTYPIYTASNRTICTNDDWYEVGLFAGERVIVDLTFTQSNSQQDLDLHWHNSAGTDLTPCTEANPSTCTTAQGQSATSNEHFEFTAPAGCSAGCDYYLVVHGWAGSRNTYSLRIEIQ